MAQRGWKLRQFAQQAERSCHYCADPVTVLTATVDHVVPRCAGGANAGPNLVISCKFCNLWKGDKTVAEFAEFVRQVVMDSTAWVRRYGELALAHLRRVWACRDGWVGSAGAKTEWTGTLPQPRARRARRARPRPAKPTADDRLAHENASGMSYRSTGRQ